MKNNLFDDVKRFVKLIYVDSTNPEIDNFEEKLRIAITTKALFSLFIDLRTVTEKNYTDSKNGTFDNNDVEKELTLFKLFENIKTDLESEDPNEFMNNIARRIKDYKEETNHN